MLRTIGAASLDELVEQAVPQAIRLDRPLNLPNGIGEHQFLQELRQIAARNQVFRSYIGLGYYDCITPSVILRNVLENPGWYTPYTPYQAEIAQGRLEGLLNFQTMVSDLTGMEVANASLLDEATAAAEAMTMLHRVQTKHVDDRGRGATVLRRRLVLSADDRGAAPARGTARHRAGRRRRADRGVRPTVRLARSCRRLTRLVSFTIFSAFIARAHRRGVLVAVAIGPAQPDAADAARRTGRGRRLRQLAAVRRADGLRRPARRVLRDARTSTCARRPAGSSASRSTRTVARPIACRFRRANSTSGARRRRRTSARRRRCWPTSPASTPSTTGRAA